MKTFDQCKDEVANNDGDEFGWTTDYEFKLNFTSLKIMMTKAAELYAQEVAKDAWEKPRVSAGLYLLFGNKLNLSLADCDDMVDFISDNFYQPNQEKP